MYKPHRDYRFEYVGDVIEFIETYQCHDCAFRIADEGDMMCEIAISIVLEEEIQALDDRGEHGVVCTRYVEEPPVVEPPDPNQLGLF